MHGLFGQALSALLFVSAMKVDDIVHDCGYSFGVLLFSAECQRSYFLKVASNLRFWPSEQMRLRAASFCWFSRCDRCESSSWE